MRRPPSFSTTCVIAIAVLAAQATACARSSAPAAAPSSRAWGNAWTAQPPPPPAWWSPQRAVGPGAIAMGEPGTRTVDGTVAPPVADAPPPIVGGPTPGVLEPHARKLDSRTIPDGEACLQELVNRGITFRTAEEKRGISTPILVEGPLGGVVYRGLGGAPFLCDCRFAVALSWIGPDLLAAGVTEAWYSGAYSYRMARVGRLSLHAYGLAIDVHEWTIQGRRLTVTNDYERGLPDPCASQNPLNRLGCVLRATGVFREMLTPDTDADHYDHFHISIVPLGEDPVRRVVKPKVPAPRSDPHVAEATAPRRDSSTPEQKEAGSKNDIHPPATTHGEAKPRQDDAKHDDVKPAPKQEGAKPTPKQEDTKPTPKQEDTKPTPKQEDAKPAPKPKETSPAPERDASKDKAQRPGAKGDQATSGSRAAAARRDRAPSRGRPHGRTRVHHNKNEGAGPSPGKPPSTGDSAASAPPASKK